jgi:hypothetical protein
MDALTSGCGMGQAATGAPLPCLVQGRSGKIPRRYRAPTSGVGRGATGTGLPGARETSASSSHESRGGIGWGWGGGWRWHCRFCNVYATTPAATHRRWEDRAPGLPWWAASASPPPDLCHTRFYKENRMHLTCAPGSNYTHMIDKMSVIPLQ